ncbi:hypothetical protein AgCh_035391 [Apium graveolens]
MALDRPGSAQPGKLRWGELEEDDGEDLDFLLPPKQVIGPDENGIKKVIEYKFNDDGNKIKMTSTTRVRKVGKARLSKRAVERRSWPKFGDAVREDVGARLTMVSTEEISLERPRPPDDGDSSDQKQKGITRRKIDENCDKWGLALVGTFQVDVGGVGSKPDEAKVSGESLAQLGKGAVLMVCRTCGKKGDHWTSRCPYKDLAPQTDAFVDKPPTSDATIPTGTTKGTYVPPSLRAGAERPAMPDMRRRNEENSVRVTNLSEDTREPDLLELFRTFGPVSRVYVAIDQKTGVSRGFGFVNFVSKEDAERAIMKLNGYGSGQKRHAEKGKAKVDQVDKEAEARAKKREADALRLKALQLQMEEIELQERTLREAMRADEPGRMNKDRRERRVYDEEDEFNSDSRPRRKRTKQPFSSDSDEEPDGSRLRLNRLEKVLFGDRRPDREPVVTQEIELYRPPPGEERQFPKMSEFNGKGDPEDHCEKYELLMVGMGHNDIMLCKMFKTYLKGSASMWYKSLKPRQRANEELGDYLVRFKEEAGMVTNLDKIKAMGFLTAGLDPYKDGKYWGYKDSRRDDRSKRTDRYEGSRSRSDRRDSRKEGRKETDRGAERRRDRDSAVFTPLNAPISKILHEIKGKPGFVRPAKMKVPNHKKNPDKYCDYHRDKGHNTDECYHLKKLIERMIKDGELNQFVRDLRDRLGPKENQEEEDSKTAKEKYVRQVYNMYQFGQAKPHMPMTLSTEDYEDVIRPDEDPLIINSIIGQNKIWKIMVDTGSSANILFYKTYCKMNLAGEQLEPCNEAPLYAIGGHPIQFEGTITLAVLLGKLPYTVEKLVKFYVVRIESPYNAIFGRPFLSTFEAVESICHLKLKFPTEKGVGEMRGDQKTARIIMLEDLEKDQEYEGPDGTGKRKRAESEPSESRETLNIELEKFGVDLSSPIAEPAAETEEVELYVGHSGKMVRIGKNMGADMKTKIIAPEAKPVKQKKRTFAVERQKVIEAEVEKLLEAKFIEEIEYFDWLANVVVVKKSNGKWRMCVDYTDLNKACPKDHYPLPNIDQLIDATAGYEVLSFLDTFSGYHQIAMNDRDVPKTTFITPKGTYAYIKMPFGLKNAGATFQRMVNKVFKEQIGRNMEAYVDDMIVKSLFQDHAEDLKKCFETL